MKKPLIVLTGPTASGKSRLSISLAKAINAEIISADSMQVYRGMDIGTAKIKPKEMEGIPHHMIDIMDPKDDYDVFMFKSESKRIVNEIYERGKNPLIVGGTGFYIQALAYDIEFTDKTDFSVRERLIKEAEINGPDVLFERLKAIDPNSAKIIDKNNIKRVVRALEFYETEHYPISKHNNEQREKDSPYNLYYFVLTRERKKLYDNINKRVDIMISEGLLDEVKKLYELGVRPGMTSEKALGYSELYSYLRGEVTLEKAIDMIKQNTRHFAKRQITWFKREKSVIMIDMDEYENDEEILEFMLGKING